MHILVPRRALDFLTAVWRHRAADRTTPVRVQCPSRRPRRILLNDETALHALPTRD